jgi:RHS repeat-associated protein
VQTDGNGLNYLRARYYHPQLRRFLSQDSVLGDVTVPATLNRYAYTRGNPIGFIDPQGNYDSDVHHDLTYALAVRVGFSQSDAEEIASANQALDEDFLAGPFFNPFARRKFHFTTPARREQMLQEANESGSMAMFGYYLHSEQDSYSHQSGLTDRDGTPDGWFWGHLFAGHAPDKTHLRPELAAKMAEGTYQQLRKFNEHTTGKKTCDDWENIRPLVDHWVQIVK